LTASASRVLGEPKASQRRQGSGRPRHPDVERRALEAARHIYGESGKSQVTFANVAARAGVGKPALYRRWETPQELLVDALRAIPLPGGIEDLGDAQAELAAYMRGLMRLYVSPDGAAMMRVITEFHDETEPFRRWITETSDGMIAHAATVIERAVDRGEPAPRLPARTVMEILTGTMLSHIVTRLHAGQLPPEEEMAEYCWELAGLVVDRPGSVSSRVTPAIELERRPPPSSRREQLIRIAQHVVAQRGLADFTLAHVAESAGVTAPALYTHFSSRTDLLEQVLEATARDYAEDMRVTDDAEASVERRLRTRLSRWATTPTGRLRIIHDAVLRVPDSPRIKLATQRARRAWTDFVVDVLTRGIARGEVRPGVDVHTATDLLTTSLFGVEVGTDTGLAAESLHALYDQLVDMFLAYVRSPSPSLPIDGRAASELP
jgi:AcrR family transcriptional regulator